MKICIPTLKNILFAWIKLLFLAMLLVKKSIEMDKEIIKKLHESV
jgi:hypothetical protein